MRCFRNVGVKNNALVLTAGMRVRGRAGTSTEAIAGDPSENVRKASGFRCFV